MDVVGIEKGAGNRLIDSIKGVYNRVKVKE